MAAAMAAKAVAKKRAGGHIKPVPFVAPELPWRSKPEVEKEFKMHGGQRVLFDSSLRHLSHKLGIKPIKTHV